MADVVHLHPTFRARVERACSVTGASVFSGARSTDRQRELFECRRQFNATNVCRCPDGCNPANPPGSSNHEFGLPGQPLALAVDFAMPSGDFSRLHDKAAELDLCFPIAAEPWHAQPVEVPEGSFVQGAYARVPLGSGRSNPEPEPDPLALGRRTALAFIGEHVSNGGSNMLVIDGGLARYAIQTFAGKALDVPSGSVEDATKIQQFARNDSLAQSWYIDPCGADEFRIIAACSGRVLDVAGGGGKGTQLIQWPWNGSDNQRWLLKKASDTTYTIESKRSGLVVDVAEASASDGAPIIVWLSGGGVNQQFRITATRDGGQFDWPN